MWPIALLALGVGILTLAPSTIEFTPSYPLWTDGMAKRRWLELPAGTAIDKSNPDRWEFPVGTRATKEFSRDGRKHETRVIERLGDGSWRFTTYAWNADGTAATLAPEEGIPERGIPSRLDCLACHDGGGSPLLGYSAVQLETRLDPAIGYLHGNCGHCHNPSALPAVDMVLQQTASDLVASTARTRTSVLARSDRLLKRMKSHDPLIRMPPLGVEIADQDAIATLEQWIRKETTQ